MLEFPHGLQGLSEPDSEVRQRSHIEQRTERVYTWVLASIRRSCQRGQKSQRSEPGSRACRSDQRFHGIRVQRPVQPMSTHIKGNLCCSDWILTDGAPRIAILLLTSASDRGHRSPVSLCHGLLPHLPASSLLSFKLPSSNLPR